VPVGRYEEVEFMLNEVKLLAVELLVVKLLVVKLLVLVTVGVATFWIVTYAVIVMVEVAVVVSATTAIKGRSAAVSIYDSCILNVGNLPKVYTSDRRFAYCVSQPSRKPERKVSVGRMSDTRVDRS